MQLAAAASTKPSRVRAEEPGPADWEKTPLSRVQVPHPQSRWKSRVWPSARSATTTRELASLLRTLPSYLRRPCNEPALPATRTKNACCNEKSNWAHGEPESAMAAGEFRYIFTFASKRSCDRIATCMRHRGLCLQTGMSRRRRRECACARYPKSHICNCNDGPSRILHTLAQAYQGGGMN